MNDETTLKTKALSEEAVEQYLKENPEFFSRHADLLSQLLIPHDSGAATSLIERQVQLLRGRNLDLNNRLNTLLNAARENDQLFKKTKKIILDLLSIHNLEEMAITLQEYFINEFNVDVCRFTLFGNKNTLNCNNARVICNENIDLADRLFQGKRVRIGKFKGSEITLLFGQTSNIQSAAAAYLIHNQVIGTLALGSKDPDHFQQTQGTLFLSFLSDVLSLLLPRYLPAGHPAAINKNCHT